MDRSPRPLEFVETDELIRELLNRCDHGAVVLMRVGGHDHNGVTFNRRWRGDNHTVMGLCFDLAGCVRDSHHMIERDMSPETEEGEG